MLATTSVEKSNTMRSFSVSSEGLWLHLLTNSLFLHLQQRTERPRDAPHFVCLRLSTPLPPTRFIIMVALPGSVSGRFIEATETEHSPVLVAAG